MAVTVGTGGHIVTCHQLLLPDNLRLDDDNDNDNDDDDPEDDVTISQLSISDVLKTLLLISD